jgi:Zn-finger nucleic acid-binding protein
VKRCQKCLTTENLTKHHILPRCFFHDAGGIVWLCRGDHDKIEKRIEKAEKADFDNPKHQYRFRLQPEEYREILQDFLNERMSTRRVLSR